MLIFSRALKLRHACAPRRHAHIHDGSHRPSESARVSMSCNNILLNEAHLSSSWKFLQLLLYSTSRNFGDMTGRGTEPAPPKLVGEALGALKFQGRKAN